MRRAAHRRPHWCTHDAGLVVPGKSPLPHAHTADAAAAAFQILEHGHGAELHLLTQSLGDDGHIDVLEQFVGVRPHPPPSSEVRMPAERQSLA